MRPARWLSPAAIAVLLIACAPTARRFADNLPLARELHQLRALTVRASAPAQMDVTFVALPFEAPDLVNPSRGYFQHYGETVHPDALGFADVYFRFNWLELEPHEGHYDFSPIAAQLARLAPGQKLAFRIMTLNSYARRDTIPLYVRQRVPGTDCGGPGRWVPDWRDPYFQARVERLFTELIRWLAADATRLQQIWHVDAGLYGNFGEGHLYPFDRGCVSVPPLEVRAWYYEMQWQVLQRYAPELRFVINSFGAQTDLFVRIASLSPQIGIRTDSFNAASGWFEGQWRYPEKLAILAERWQTAPHFVEFIEREGRLVDASFERALAAILQLPIAGVANNGFHRDLRGLSHRALENARFIGRLSGYRFVLRGVSYPAQLEAGAPLTIRSVWSNLGATPLYEPFAVTYELYDGEQLVWQGVSQLALTQLLPTVQGAQDLPVVVDDRFVLELAPGRYTLALRVLDPTGYRLPLQLAIEGRDAQGRYHIGELTLGAAQAMSSR